jgi:membrane protease YdiL (CAAX protease family)
MNETSAPSAEKNARRLSVLALIGVVIVYLVILQGVSIGLKPAGLAYGHLPSGSPVWRTITLPVTLSIIFGALVVTYLRWWRPVIKDDKPVSGWVKIVPALLIVSIIGTTGYSNLANQSAGLVLLLLGSTLLVGVGEELMFRGISIVALRGDGLSEAKVALWSSVLFGAVHMTNIFTEGPSAFLQAAVVSVTGYFFYLTRRSFGIILVPMVIHGLYDFSIFSHSIGLAKPEASAQTLIPMLVSLILAIIVFARRKKIEPGPELPG